MIDFTKFPLGLRVRRDQENNDFTIWNSLKEKIRVTVLISPDESISLAYIPLVNGQESKIQVEVVKNDLPS